MPYEVEVTNAGTETATDVRVSFPFPSDFVHTSNGASQGSYDVWLNEWQLGSIAGGATATLDLVLFPLAADDDAIAFAQVAAQGGPGDVDSSPGNGNPQQAREDDEARLVLAPGSARQSAAGRSALQLNDLRLGDAPDVHVLTFTTRDAVQATAQLIDPLGRHLRAYNLDAQGGTQQVELSTANLPRGTYFLMVTTAGRAQSLPLVVVR